MNKKPEYHYYSIAAVDEIVSKICSDEKYLNNARQNYQINTKKTKA
jgi:hypothetical protein